ncbi:hypothetical protein SCA6_004302, partial [Theobroma cacao]
GISLTFASSTDLKSQPFREKDIIRMNKLNFVREGMTKLPPGFRFQPTDEELVFQYLKCKVFSFPLPASIIPEINVCKYDPWDLPVGARENYLNHHMEKWVVCRIFLKKRSEDETIQSFCNNNHEEKKSMAVPHEPKFFYFMREKTGITPASSSSSSSSSSSITEVSSSGADLEESSSHNIVR